MKMKNIFRSMMGQAMFSLAINALIFLFSIIRVYFFSKGLAVDQFGVLSLMLTMSAFGTYFFTLGSFQYVFKNSGYTDRKYLALRTAFSLSIIIAVVAALFFYLYSTIILNSINLKGYKDIFFLNALATFLMSFLMLISFVRMAELKNNTYNFIQLLRQVPWILVCLILYLTYGKISLFTIFVVINCSLLFSILISLKPADVKGLFANTELDFRGLFSYSMPLLPYYLGIWGIPMIIRTSIGTHLGFDTLAIFSVSYTMVDIIFLFVSSVTSILIPYFFSSNDEADGKLLYNRLIKLSFLGTLCAVFSVLVFRKEIITIMTSDKYMLASNYIIYLFPLALIKIVSLCFEQYYLKTATTSKLGFIYLTAIVVTFVSAKLLIPQIGVWGAVITSLLPYLLIIMLLYPGQRKYIDLRMMGFDKLLFVSVFLTAIASIVLAFNMHFAFRMMICFTALAISLVKFNLWDEQELFIIANYSQKIKLRFIKV
jgi:O-antigen/teichoic acid export membrane protein